MESKTSEHVTIYTDGGCDPNPGAGGWAAILMYKGTSKELSGGALRTTNNRMELTAAVEALKALRRPCSAVVYTDSEYMKKGITEWCPAWKRLGWKRKAGTLKNVDIWKELDAMTQIHRVQWRWVAAHAGNPHNERCHTLASEALAGIKELEKEVSRMRSSRKRPSRKGSQIE
jgi:ribonuclease HI